MWKPTENLTQSQMEYIKNFGGRLEVTSPRTGSVMRFSVIPTRNGKGVAINIVSGEETHYVGYIPKKDGVPTSRFCHTKASSFEADNIVFKTFDWMWRNWDESLGKICKGF